MSLQVVQASMCECVSVCVCVCVCVARTQVCTFMDVRFAKTVSEIRTLQVVQAHVCVCVCVCVAGMCLFVQRYSR